MFFSLTGCQCGGCDSYISLSKSLACDMVLSHRFERNGYHLQ